MSFADQYLRQEKVTDNTEALIKILELLSTSEAKIGDIPKQELEDLKKSKTRCEYQVKPLIEVYREKAWQAWKDFSEPTIDLAQAISDHESSKIDGSEAQKKREEERKDKEGSTYIPPRDFHDNIIEIENAVYLIDPITGKVQDKPLKYSKQIEWADFANKVHLNPYSHTVDLYKTMLNLMEEAGRVGCTRDQLCEIYKLFVFNHMQESYNSLAYEKDSEMIFDILMGLLDVTSHLTRLKACLKDIKRKPQEGIAKPVRAYQSIINEVLSLQSPNATEKENREQAEKEASKAVRYFTTKAVWAEVQKYKELFRNKNHRYASLTELFGFVNDLECQPGYKPVSTLSLDNQEVKIDLFLTDTQQNWTCDFTQPDYEEDLDDYAYEVDEDWDGEEIHTNETMPEYQNLSVGGSYTAPTTSTVSAHDRTQTRSTSNPTHQHYHRYGNYGPSPPRNVRGRGRGRGRGQGRGRVASYGTGSSRPARSKTPSGSGSGSGSRASAQRSSPARDGASGSPGFHGWPTQTGSRRNSQSPGRGRARNRSSESTGSQSRRPRSQGSQSGSPTGRGRSPSAGRCWTCWKRHPDGRCDYGKIKPASTLCNCGQGYHPKVVCLNGGKVKETKKDPKKESKKDGEKPNPPFMPFSSTEKN